MWLFLKPPIYLYTGHPFCLGNEHMCHKIPTLNAHACHFCCTHIFLQIKKILKRIEDKEIAFYNISTKNNKKHGCHFNCARGAHVNHDMKTLAAFLFTHNWKQKNVNVPYSNSTLSAKEKKGRPINDSKGKADLPPS